MADNTCGPSNALQNFQKHTGVDRTLQQDRLVNRPSPSQGFKSVSGASAGRLDPEFAAFQAGHPPLESQGLHPQALPHPSQSFQRRGPAGWASDFQRLNISNPTPQLQPFIPQRQDAGGWHQDFARQQNGRVADKSMHMPAGQVGPAYQGSSMSGMHMSAGQAGPSYQNYPMNGMHMGTQQMGGFMNAQAQSGSAAYGEQKEEAFDEQAFARAFEEAAKQEEVLAQQELGAKQDHSRTIGIQEGLGQQQEVQQTEEVLLDKSAERLMESEGTLATQGLIGADQIHHPSNTATQNRDQPEDSDALSRTAGELLGRVELDQSTKFQNSTFLALMRQLRDKEVTVEGDKIVRPGMRDGGAAGGMMDGSAPAQA